MVGEWGRSCPGSTCGRIGRSGSTRGRRWSIRSAVARRSYTWGRLGPASGKNLMAEYRSVSAGAFFSCTFEPSRGQDLTVEAHDACWSSKRDRPSTGSPSVLAFAPPMSLASMRDPFDDPDWTKWDGFRAPCVHREGPLQARVPARARLQVVAASVRRTLAVRPLLHERKRLLRGILRKRASSIWIVEHVERRGIDLFRAVCERDVEGVVAKWRCGTYQSGPHTSSAEDPQSALFTMGRTTGTV